LKKIGLLGGSFDPPHKGHLYISLEAKKLLKLNEVWWLVTPQNPLKISEPTTYKERIKNCCKITRGHPIKITEIEKKIESSYSYQSINFIQNHYKNIKFFWLMGADNLVNFHRWQHWEIIFKDISIVVFKRYGYNNQALNSKAAKKFTQFQKIINPIDKMNFSHLPSWTWINNREVKISSTEIRKQRYLLRGSN
jgi:nicotinate-nucleotide adenylyltransferase|tara:strand:+ start:156 stop:737 length:582 start_codon:yes stop_codon:yes gene_type:complete